MNLLWIMIRASIYMLDGKLFMLSAKMYVRGTPPPLPIRHHHYHRRGSPNKECIPPHGRTHCAAINWRYCRKFNPFELAQRRRWCTYERTSSILAIASAMFHKIYLYFIIHLRWHFDKTQNFRVLYRPKTETWLLQQFKTLTQFIYDSSYILEDYRSNVWQCSPLLV